MIYYKCYCNECKSNDKLFKYYNFVIWKKIKNIQNNNIIWKKNTWFSYRGYLNNENMYLLDLSLQCVLAVCNNETLICC